MKKVCVVMILLVIMIIGCGEKEAITIGFSAGLSGETSALGNSLRNSLMMKVDEVNEAGGINGRMIEVIVRDDENDLDKVREVDRFFIDEGVTLIFGHDYSYKAEAMLEATAGQDIIVFSATMATATIAGIDDNFFRTTPTGDLQGKAIGEFVEGKFHHGLVICDSGQTALVDTILNGYETAFTGDFQVYKIDSPVENDLEVIMRDLETIDYDHVFLIARPEDTMRLSSIINLENEHMPILSASWGMNTTSDAQKAYPEGLIFAADDNLETDGYRQYLQDYEDKYGEKPGNAAINAYEGATVLFEGLRQAENLTYEGIKKSLLNLEFVETATSVTRFDAYGDAVKVMYRYEVRDGEIVLMSEGGEGQ